MTLTFKQYYGWYINQTEFRLGIRNNEYIKDYAPEEVTSLIDERRKYQNKLRKLTSISCSNIGEISKLQKIISKLSTKINRFIENITREEFGYSKIGEGNISESILAKIINNIFPEYKIKRHLRPKWLEGLELDIYIPEINLGIEYQGQQHFYAIKAWGGKKALEEQKSRDARKRLLCKENKLNLVEVDYTEPLEYDYIKQKIEKYREKTY